MLCLLDIWIKLLNKEHVCAVSALHVSEIPGHQKQSVLLYLGIADITSRDFSVREGQFCDFEQSTISCVHESSSSSLRKAKRTVKEHFCIYHVKEGEAY